MTDFGLHFVVRLVVLPQLLLTAAKRRENK